MPKVGDIVHYKGREWLLNSIYGGKSKETLCKIVAIRDGQFAYKKKFKQGGYEWEETYLNANITNLNIKELEEYGI